jgi:hypothetical protein
LQRVFRAHQQCRRRAPACALQGGQHLDDFGAARFQRAANLRLTAVERTQPQFGIADIGFDGAYFRGGIDQLLVELAAVLSDRRDFGLQPLLQFGRALLLDPCRLQLLFALLDRIGRNRGWRRGLREHRRGKTCGQQRDRQRNGDGGTAAASRGLRAGMSFRR